MSREVRSEAVRDLAQAPPLHLQEDPDDQRHHPKPPRCQDLVELYPEVHAQMPERHLVRVYPHRDRYARMPGNPGADPKDVQESLGGQAFFLDPRGN